MKKLFPMVMVAVLSLSACGTDPDDAGANQIQPYDVSDIQVSRDLSADVSSEIRDSGVLRVATSADYEPAEFLDVDGKTPMGYDIDIMNAIAKKLGLKVEYTNAPFDSILPAVGSKYDAAISAFGISPERMEKVNMISYMRTGSLFMVNKGNPESFDPTNICGKKVGVQSGASQQTWLEEKNKECGSNPVKVLPETDAQMLATKLSGKQLDAIFLDSTAASFTASKNNDKFETIGDVQDTTDMAILVNKADSQLASVVQKATAELNSDGTIGKILEHWKIDPSSTINNPTLNPQEK